MVTIRLTNTLTRYKEIFQTHKNNEVSLYICGITPYYYAHIGHARSFVSFDLLVRFLRFAGYKVNYVRNVTDIEDKLLARAERETGDVRNYHQIAQKFIKNFREDMHTLQCISPDHEPLVTENISEIIHFITGLINKGVAYKVDGDVYFDTLTFVRYGILSGKKVDELQVGIRVEVNEKKRNPADFVLWKGNSQNLFWQSPWGYGRPGWHIECSAIIRKYLGSTVDIHGGGADLIFPHHENEIAQSESFSGQPFVRYWLHSAMVMLNKEKMSKSLGNVMVLHDLFKEHDPMVIRFYILQHHYRTPLDFSFEGLKAAQVAYKKLISVLHETKGRNDISCSELERMPLAFKIISALADDLNTPQALGIIFENIEDLRNSPQAREYVSFIMRNLMGLTLQVLKEKVMEITPEIQSLISQREEARSQKNWERADQIRKQLADLGYEVRDKKI